MRGRLRTAGWLAPFDLRVGRPYCEGNAWHYNWSVFHDVQGSSTYGSDEAFTAKIDSVFTVPNIIRRAPTAA